MAIASVENGVMVSYRGVTIYHVYKNDWADQPPREYWFTLDPFGSEDDEEAFDIREQQGYNRDFSTAENLVRMIDAGNFGPHTCQRGEMVYSGDETKSEVCPVCGAAITEYGSLEIHDESIEYPFTCKNCGVSGSEWGKVVFDGYIV